MGNGPFLVGKLSVGEKVRDGGTFGVLLLKTAQADSTLIDHTTVTSLLAANTEADFTNYRAPGHASGRVTGIVPTLGIDTATNLVLVDIPDQTLNSPSPAGGATNNTTAKLIVFLDGANDTARVPLLHYDFVVTTTGAAGSDVLAQVPGGLIVA